MINSHVPYALFVYQIPLSKPNRENVYLTELHNAISNQDGDDLRNAINRRNISDVIGGVCIIRNGRDNHRDVFLPSNERRIDYSFEIQNVS
jgi:hypothetical protein